MTHPRLTAAGLCLLAGTFLYSAPAPAAESYDSCAGYIDALPVVITTQGTWCLRADLSTAITGGHAIAVQANNVTIDCNHFKLGGLAAGSDSQAIGIYSGNRLNTTVRHCNVRGFFTGMMLQGSGHVVEGNRLDGNLYIGIFSNGGGNVVRDNQVFDTGGFPSNEDSYGIFAQGDVMDNLVDGVFATADTTYTTGIQASGMGALIARNRVRNVLASGVGNAYGIILGGPGMRAERNHVAQLSQTSGIGIYGASPFSSCTGNTVVGYTAGLESCTQSIDNLVHNAAP